MPKPTKLRIGETIIYVLEAFAVPLCALDLIKMMILLSEISGVQNDKRVTEEKTKQNAFWGCD
jgi:hypothetical protein